MTSEEKNQGSIFPTLVDRLTARIRTELEAVFEEGVVPLERRLQLSCHQCGNNKRFRVDLELVNGFDFSGAKVGKKDHIMCLSCGTTGYYHEFKPTDDGDEHGQG